MDIGCSSICGSREPLMAIRTFKECSMHVPRLLELLSNFYSNDEIGNYIRATKETEAENNKEL